MFRGKGGQAEARELAVGLYREHRGYLLRIACSNTKSMAVAEEALQEAFISFLRHFDPGRGAPPIAWLILTLKRECQRRQGREKWDRRAGQEREWGEDVTGFVLESIPSRATGPEERVAERDHAQRQLAQLKPNERTGLGLQAAGFPYREIAERRGWTYTKANRCITEGRAALRRSRLAK
jgi:RNA polymerase sigma factor (sigma-70 family)